MRSQLGSLVLALFLFACGGATTQTDNPATGETGDAGADAQGADAQGSDAAADASSDVSVDTSKDAPPSFDASLDLGIDAPPKCAGCAGCCDPGGNCVAGTSPAACGSGGAACSDCTVAGLGCDAKRTCSGAPAACDAKSCPTGCCDANGVCRAGTTVDACGTGGVACADCAAKLEACTAGVCEGSAPGCDAKTCSGCCDAMGVCRGGTADGACGFGGAACDDCNAAGRSCIAAARYCGTVPLCSSVTCPSGCCDATGTCRTGREDAACGTAGGACADCGGAGKACSAVGYCYAGKHCGADNCAGCCSPSGDCLAGTDASACGRFGNVCSSCGADPCKQGVCDTGSTCPAGYAGCTPGTVAAPPTFANDCSDADLAALAQGCAGTNPGKSCDDALGKLAGKSTACFSCISQFLGPAGYPRCLARWLTADCNAALACAYDCGDAVCGKCTGAAKSKCGDDAFSTGGACQGFILGAVCAQAALQGPGAFCDFQEGKTDVGQWIAGVATYYCH